MFPCPDASNDMQHDLVRSHFDQLTWGKKMKLTFWGLRIYSSIRLDETNTLVPTTYIVAVHIKMKKLFAVKDFAQKQLFWLRRPLEAKPLTLCQMWRQLPVSKFNFLSNAVIGFALAIIVPEIMELFRNDVRQSRKTLKFGHFFALGITFLTLAENWLT